MSSHYFLQANSSSKSYHDYFGLMKEKPKPQLKIFYCKDAITFIRKKRKRKRKCKSKILPKPIKKIIKSNNEITKLRQIYISAQKNYKQPRQLKINNIHKPKKKKSFM